MELLKSNIKSIYFKYLFASMESAIVMSIYSFVDTIAVGQSEGPNGTAAMAVIAPLYGATVFFAILCGIGGSVLMSNAKGEGNEKEANSYFTAAPIKMSVLTAIFWVSFALFAETIFTIFGADESIMPLVMKYARWIIIFCPVFLFSVFLACFIRNDNAPRLAMRSVLIGGAVNIFGDWFFVFPLGMGISGAAIATVIGTTIQTLILCSHFLSPACQLKLVKPNKLFGTFKKIVTTGFASGLLDLANVVLICILNNKIVRYGGSAQLAVFGVIATIASLFQALFSGVGQALQPIVSTNFGAGEAGRIKTTFRMAMTTVILMGILFTSIGLLFPSEIIRLFMTATPEFLAIAPSIIRIYFLTFLIMGVNVLCTYYLQSILKTKMSLTLAFLRGVVISGLLLNILPVMLGIRGVWSAMPLSECIVTVIVGFYFLYIHLHTSPKKRDVNSLLQQ